MPTYLLGLFGLLLLVTLLFMGMRVGIAMALVGFLGIWYMRSLNVALNLMMNTPFATVRSETLSVIPLFILMGVVCANCGISQELYQCCYKFVSRMRGGLAVATILACGCFSAICGSASATTAAMGKICLPEMDRFKYKRTLTCGSISAGGTFGILIPPSVGFMLYAINAGIGVGTMFIAGIVPGLILILIYSIVALIICTIDPEAGPKGPIFTLVEKLKSTVSLIPVGILFIIVLGGITFGICSATEGAAVGATGAFIFMMIRKQFNLKNVISSLKESAETTAMIFMIMIGANLFSNFISATGLPQTFAKLVAGTDVHAIIVLVFCLLIYAILATFIDALPLIVLLTPIFLPVIRSLDFGFTGGTDPVTIWFGVLMVMLMSFGIITPPVGMCCYVMAGVAPDTPLSTIFRGTFPFVIGLVVMIAIVIAFPSLATWLPGLTGGQKLF